MSSSLLNSNDSHEQFMQEALNEASQAKKVNEVPVGAIIINKSYEIIGRGYNLRESSNCATAHAEILAIQKACKKLNNWRLSDCTLYVTLEPCFMCAGAIILARIPKVIYGAVDPKAGAVKSLANVLNDDRLNHKCEVISGICEKECSELLKNFFKEKRK